MTIPYSRACAVVGAAAWLAIAAAFAHLALGPLRPSAAWLHAPLAFAAGAAALAGAVTLYSEDRRTGAVAVIGGATVSVLATLLAMGRLAHETGVAIAVLGVVVSVAGLLPCRAFSAATGAARRSNRDPEAG